MTLETYNSSVNQFLRIVKKIVRSVVLIERCKLRMEYNDQRRREFSPRGRLDGNCRSSCRQTATVYRVVHPVRTILTS